MDKLKYVKLEQPDGSYSDSIPLAVDADHVDVNGNTLTSVLDNKADNTDISNLQTEINRLASGSPLVVSSISDMTDTTRIYVNTTNGHWYWYDGITRQDGGVYQAAEDSETLEILKQKIEVPYKIIENSIISGLWMGTSGKISTGIGDKLTIFPVEANKSYIIYSTNYKLNTNNYYFAYLGFTNTYPEENVNYTQILSGTGNNDITPINYTYTPTENGYILIRNEALSSVSVWEINSIYNSIIEIYKALNEYNKQDKLTGCVFMSLGDSVTAEGYYINKLRDLIKPSKYYNLAVPSATWSDREETTSYDGNPSFSGDQNQNVLGNQLQKIIDNPNVYDTDPDIILIAAGINDGNGVPYDNISKTATDTEIKNAILTHFKSDINSNTQIPITTPTFDQNDTYEQHRKSVAGSMRYVITKLESMYPNARIYISTPIQNSIYYSRDYMNIQHKQRYITETTKFLSVPIINIGEECGICSEYEYQGALWDSSLATETYPKMGRDLIDGLHPNDDGGWKIAKYVYSKIKEYYK